MKYIPQNKHDLESIKSLNQASNDEIKPYLAELIEWVGDINWPVAYEIATRLQKCDKEIIPHIKNILKSDDEVLKYNVLAHIVCHLERRLLALLIDDIRRITENPTKGESEEEVNLIANNAIGVYEFNA